MHKKTTNTRRKQKKLETRPALAPSIALPQYNWDIVGGKVTGGAMLQFKIKNAMSDGGMCALFNLSQAKMRDILSSGSRCVDDPVVCYLFRQYVSYPELMKSDINLKTLYESIGGESVMRSSDFSLILGRELSAYTRYFRESSDGSPGRPAPSLRLMIGNAMRLSGGDPVKAVSMIIELCRIEGESRNFDPLVNRSWRKPVAGADGGEKPRAAAGKTANVKAKPKTQVKKTGEQYRALWR